MLALKRMIAKLLRETADKIDAGTCELSEQEAEHVKQDMLEYYGVEDANEPPAYTIGFLIMKMLQVFNNL